MKIIAYVWLQSLWVTPTNVHPLPLFSCLPPMQLSVCAQFISFAAELFPTAANNTASLCHLLQQAAAPVYPAVEWQRVAVCRYLCRSAGSAGYLLAALVLLCPCSALACFPSFVAHCSRMSPLLLASQHTFPLNLLAGSCCKRPKKLLPHSVAGPRWATTAIAA